MMWSLEDILVFVGLRSLRVVFLLTLGSFVLLVFTTFSVPLITTFYFIDVSVPAGVRFGVWGWCYDSGGNCPNSPRIGYNFGSQVETSLTNALVFYPIATVLCLFSTLALVPLLYGYPTTKYPFRAYSLLTFTTFVVSSVAFVFAVGLWGTVVTKFSAEGVGVTFGPLLWMSLVETVVMGLVSLSSGWGDLWTLCVHGRQGRLAWQRCNFFSHVSEPQH